MRTISLAKELFKVFENNTCKSFKNEYNVGNKLKMH